MRPVNVPLMYTCLSCLLVVFFTAEQGASSKRSLGVAIAEWRDYPGDTVE